MMKPISKIAKYAVYISLVFSVIACKEEIKKPLTHGEKPSKIREYNVSNFAGGADITYEVPDEWVAYVVAEYEIKLGVKREARSSKYKDNITVEGFPSAGQYTVTLFTVGRDEQRSEPLIIQVNPLKPPVSEVFETLKLIPDFGGANVSGENVFESNLVFDLITLNEDNEWQVIEQLYTSSKNIKFSARGFNTDLRKFGVYVRDRWLNYSDTLFGEFSPYFEAQIDMSNFYETNLPGDQHEMHQVGAARRMSWLFDGRTGNQTQGYYSPLNSGVPQHFTIFLQGTYHLSRIKLWQHIAATATYNSANPRKFRVWGSMDPNPDGSFDESWYVLGEFENIKPSGTPSGNATPEDLDVARAGEEYVFDLDIQPCRYIRFETLETWGLTQHVYITEMAFWGSKIE